MLKLAITGYSAYPPARFNACPFTPVTNEVPALVVGAVFEMDSFNEPSKVQCAFKLEAPTSFELLNPPMGEGGAMVSFFLQVAKKVTVKIANEIPRVRP